MAKAKKAQFGSTVPGKISKNLKADTSGTMKSPKKYLERANVPVERPDVAKSKAGSKVKKASSKKK